VAICQTILITAIFLQLYIFPVNSAIQCHTIVNVGRYSFAMSKSQIAIRIPSRLLEKLNEYVERTGTSKTEVVVGALAEYLGCAEDIPISQRVAALESKVKELQALMKQK